MPFDSTKFYVGVNIGWIREWYGHDLGTGFANPRWHPVPDPIFRSYIEKAFLHLKLRKIRVVRFFVFDDLEGLSYGLSTEEPIDFSRYNPELVIMDSHFLNRISIIMQAAQTNQIQVYWTLFDGTRLLRNADTRSLVKTSLIFIIQNLSSSLFVGNVLSQLITTLLPYQANIFAIDICNEVDWLWARESDPMIRYETVVTFIRALSDYIHSQIHGIQITASFAKYSQLSSHYSDFSFLDFFDYHRYYDRISDATHGHGQLPNWIPSSFGGKSCIIGEIGYHYPGESNLRDFLSSEGNGTSETEQNFATTSLLNNAIAGGYFGALAWRYTSYNDPYRDRDDGLPSLPNDFITRLLRKGNLPEHFRRTQSEFLDAFIRVGEGANGTSPADFFQEFERPVWGVINTFIDTLTSDPERDPLLPPLT